jgi:hypothetical protein
MKPNRTIGQYQPLAYCAVFNFFAHNLIPQLTVYVMLAILPAKNARKSAADSAARRCARSSAAGARTPPHCGQLFQQPGQNR